MARLFVAIVVIAGLVGSVHMQGPQQPQPPMGNGGGMMGNGGGMMGNGGGMMGNGGGMLGNLGGNGGPLGGLLGGLLGQQQPGQMQGQGNLLSSLGLGGQMQGMQGQQQNLLQMLGQIPARTLAALQNLLGGGRNMMNQNGMNSQNPMGFMNGMQNPMNGMNMQNPMNGMNMQNPMNGMQLPQALNGLTRPVADALSSLPQPLNGLTQPVTDALRQGRLPDTRSLTQGLTNTLQRSLSAPANGNTNVPATA